MDWSIVTHKNLAIETQKKVFKILHTLHSLVKHILHSVLVKEDVLVIT